MAGGRNMTVVVTADNYIRAESDVSFAGTVRTGGLDKFAHDPLPGGGQRGEQWPNDRAR